MFPPPGRFLITSPASGGSWSHDCKPRASEADGATRRSAVPSPRRDGSGSDHTLRRAASTPATGDPSTPPHDRLDVEQHPTVPRRAHDVESPASARLGRGATLAAWPTPSPTSSMRTSRPSATTVPTRSTRSMPSCARTSNAAFARFRDDPDAWVAIVTGQGRAFCVGADLKDGAGSAGVFAGTFWEKPTLNSFESGWRSSSPSSPPSTATAWATGSRSSRGATS